MKIQLVVISVITVSLISSRACAQYDPNHFDPDNAAHWYRKAFDLYDEPNDFDLDEYIHYRIKLSLEIDHYLKQQKPVVKLLARAALIENYDWEFYPSPGNFTPSYLSDARDCAVLLLADARYAIDNEDPTIFSERIDHCLTLSLRIDRGDTLSFLTSAGMRSRTYAFIREYLNNHPDCSLEHLQAVKGLLLNNGNRHYNSYRDLLDYEAQRAHIILGNQDSNLLISIPLWESLLNPAENTIQQDFYKRNYDFYEKYITQLKQASEQPYSEAVESIKEIEEELKQKWRDCYKRFQGIPEGYKATQKDCDYTQQYDFIYTICDEILYSPFISFNLSIFDIITNMETNRNALQTGVDLLIDYRETQQIPDELPPDSPKDLFSNKPFLILKDMDGFTLKCQGKAQDSLGSKAEYEEYRFNFRYVPKQNKNETITDPNNAVYWYEKAANLISLDSVTSGTESLLRHVVHREVGSAADNEIISEIITDISSGESHVNLMQYIRGNTKSTPAVRNLVNSQRPIIDLYLKAASLDNCQWETVSENDRSDPMEILASASDSIVKNAYMIEALKLVIADALIKAENGDTGSAADNILAILNINKHYNLRTGKYVSWYQYSELELFAQGLFHLLHSIENDWLALSRIKAKLDSLSIETDNKQQIYAWQTINEMKELEANPPTALGRAALDYTKEYFGTSANDLKTEFVNVDPKAISSNYRFARNAIKECIDHPFNTADSLFEKIKQQYKEKAGTFKNGQITLDLNIVYISQFIDHWRNDYHAYIYTQANLRACQIAVEIALIKRKTGHYPTTLPEQAPSDPFTGESFVYSNLVDHFRLLPKAWDSLTYQTHQWQTAQMEQADD